MIESIGILGAGKLGLVLAKLALRAGFRVNIAGSGNPEEISLSMSVLAPGAVAMNQADVIKHSDIIVLALPLGKYKTITTDGMSGKLVIDAMNYWWEADGIRPEFDDPNKSTSEIVRDLLPTDRVVKAFSHMGYHDLLDSTRPKGDSGRKAIAFAGDNQDDIRITESLIDKLGFDPVHIGTLSEGIKLQPGSNLFGANPTKAEILELLDAFPESALGKRVA